MMKTTGDYHHWAEVWAIESAGIAALAYRGISFKTVELDSNQHIVRINIDLPTNYLDSNKGFAAQQLARAGVRLAQLLEMLADLHQTGVDGECADGRAGHSMRLLV